MKWPWEFLSSTGHLHSLLKPLFRSDLIFWLEIKRQFSTSVLSEPDIELYIATSPTRQRARSLVSQRDMDRLDCYGSGDDAEVEHKI
jgi:hypothetical protein